MGPRIRFVKAHILNPLFRFVLFPFALLGAVAFAQTSVFTSPLPTGVRLDPVGEAVELGSMPLNGVSAPGGDKAVIALCGWREQGIQIVDLKSRQVTQTLLQDGAFYGAAFSPDGNTLYVSGGNTDLLFIYSWKNGAATLTQKLELAKAKTAEGTGTSYPAGIAVSPNGKFVYVAENVGDRLAVVDTATGEIVQRFPTDHYPYGVIRDDHGFRGVQGHHRLDFSGVKSLNQGWDNAFGLCREWERLGHHGSPAVLLNRDASLTGERG